VRPWRFQRRESTGASRFDWIRRVWRRPGARLAGARETPADWRDVLGRRIFIVASVLAIWVAAIEVRLGYLQIIDHADLVARAGRQQMRTRPAPAKRGDIVDRHGHILATSVDTDTIYAVPTEIGNAEATAAKLCEALGDCKEKERRALVDRLSQSRDFAYVRRQASPDAARRVADLNLEGVSSLKESRRFYPNRELAAHVVGYAGVDNIGLNGIEVAYDSQIRGKPGTVLIQTDARRHAFSRFEKPPTSGSTIELTIDQYLQHVAERELHAGIVANRAAGGSAIIMDPHTGEILAMANEPTFNPNAYREFDDARRRNRAVQDLYEPGSTFKVVTASAAIDEKVMPVDTLIDTSPGVLHIVGRPKPVTEFGHHDYGVLSFTDVLVRSSNIGAIKIGFRVGTDRLSRYVSRFGFGHPVSPDFPGESPGIVWSPEKWTESALASVSMGYQVGVTPLQMVTAVSSVANGGQLVEPRVIRAIDRDNRRYAVQPRVVRRTISADTAAVLTTIMEGVVGDKHGTATRAQIPGYTIAGKTGTAAKLIGGRYSTSDYNASFVGFVPSRDPVVAIIVVTDSPRTYPYTGGYVSAPVFKRIAEATLRYLGIGPSINPPSPVLVARNDSEGAMAAPVASAPVVSPLSDDSPGTVPDLRGLSAREATHTLAGLGLTSRMLGDGVVISQDPPPGAPLDAVSICRLTLDRSPARLPGKAQP
jgi:cell division protein FtsI (penicillin-binding protein 3)